MSVPFAEEYDEAPPEPPEDEQEEGTDYLGYLRHKLLDRAALDSLPEPDPLIDGTMFIDSLVWLQGRRGNGKSFVALDIAGCIGTGTKWHGRPVMQGTVLYVVAEGASGTLQRVEAWEQGYATDMTGVQWLPVAVQASGPRQWQALVDLATEIRPVLIILDTQARVTVGMEENAAKDMGEFVDQLERLRRATRACVMVVHHQGRNGDHMRGSTALEGAASTILQVVKEDDELKIACLKQKDAEEFGEFTLRMKSMGRSVTLMETDGAPRATGGAAMKTAATWWEIFGSEAVSVTRLLDADIASRSSMYRHIAELRKAGLVNVKGTEDRRSYRLVADPAHWAGGADDDEV